MADDNLDKIKQRIRKLLNLARDGGATEAEVESAMAFARKLMEEHHLSEDQCVLEDVMFCKEGAKSKFKRTSPWELMLAVAVEMTVGTVNWYRQTRRYPGTRRTHDVQFMFYGPAQDVSLAMEMWEAMHFVIHLMATKNYGSSQRGPGRDYALGFAQSLLNQARQYTQHERSPECRDVVHVRSRAAQEWLERCEPDLNVRDMPRRPIITRDQVAVRHGVEDGKNYSLGSVKRRVGESTRRKSLT